LRETNSSELESFLKYIPEPPESLALEYKDEKPVGVYGSLFNISK